MTQHAESVRERLSRLWGTPPGLGGALSAVNHRTIGVRYMVTSFVFFLIAGIEALVMRAQLTVPMAEVLGPERYNQFFTMHGSTMMFLFLVPFLEGLSIYLVPLMLGARDMVFPRLNAFGYWIFLFAGVMLHLAFLFGRAPNSGWFNYVPLTGPGFSTRSNIDFWVTMITFLEVAALVAAAEVIVTIFRQRAPGMSLGRMPIFVWSSLLMAFMIVFAMPALVAASLLLGLDRLVGTHFFNPAAGGDVLLWQHLFWFFGHPDVYIMLLPALGVVSMILPVSCGRPIAGYRLVVLAQIAIAFISFGLWVHHMYATGLPLLGLNFFAAASMMITVPSAIQIAAFVVTMWRGRPTLDTATLYCAGFLVLFILGGITGVMVGSVPFDWQAHDTFFVVAHFHYVLFGAVVFPVLAGIYFWFPKFTGRMPYEQAGRWSFWLTFIGFNLTFFPMHFLGFEGMPRRIYTYLPEMRWVPLNVVATAGAALTAVGVLVFVVSLLIARGVGRRAPDNPWGADSLEWATSSPPPNYNFQRFPVVHSANPLWQGPHPIEGDPGPGYAWREIMAEPAEDIRETIITSALDAAPEYRVILPGPSVWPLWTALALGVAFVGGMVSPLLVLVGLGLTAAALFGWLAPGGGRDEAERAAPPPGALPLRPPGRSAVASGVVVLIVIEATVFASLLVSYYFLRLGTPLWPPAGIDAPRLLMPAIGQASLLLSAGVMWGASRALRRGEAGTLQRLLPLGVSLVVAYLVLKQIELRGLSYSHRDHAYGSIVWTLNGYQMLHGVAVALIALLCWLLSLARPIGLRLQGALDGLSLYWYFVAVAGLFGYAVLYLTPYVL